MVQADSWLLGGIFLFCYPDCRINPGNDGLPSSSSRLLYTAERTKAGPSIQVVDDKDRWQVGRFGNPFGSWVSSILCGRFRVWRP